MKNICYLLLLLLLANCGTSKPKIQTTQKKVVTPNTHTPSTQKPTPAPSNKPSETLIATSSVKVTPEVIHHYVAQFKDIAMNNMKEHGVPASITLAQGILESGAGTGSLCRSANNHFGIKCHKEWNGESVNYDDDAAQECFRKYTQPSESYRDHSLFLTTRPWYAPLFKLDKYDYKSWAIGLKKAGYATDPKYPEKLITIIERYQLHQYDSKVLGFVFIPKETTPPASPHAPLHTVLQGETLYAIAKKYNTTVEIIKQKNNLIDNALTIGQQLIIF